MKNNWITNNRMEKILKKITQLSFKELLEINMEQLDKLFFPPFKQIKDCVIISESPISTLESFFDKSIKIFADKTGYEASNTETRINSYFENTISSELGVKIALTVLEVWTLQLKKMEPNSKFCLILLCDEHHVEIRFHKIHVNEKMWLDENIENYTDEAVGYVIV